MWLGEHNMGKNESAYSTCIFLINNHETEIQRLTSTYMYKHVSI